MVPDVICKEILDYWNNWKKFPSYKTLGRKDRKKVEKLLQQLASAQGNAEVLVEVAENLLTLAGWVVDIKWSDYRPDHRVDIFTKCDNFFLKIKSAMTVLLKGLEKAEGESTFTDLGESTYGVFQKVFVCSKILGEYEKALGGMVLD